MAITNPTKYVTVRRLERYKQKLADLFAAKNHTHSDKADKVSGSGIENHVAGLTSGGNPKSTPLTVDPTTGELATANPISIVGAQGKKFQMCPTSGMGTVGDNVDMGWNWANRDGAGAAFRSSANPSNSGNGNFMIFARDAENTAQLRGYPDGRLTWNDKNVATADDLAQKANTNHNHDSRYYKKAEVYTKNEIDAMRGPVYNETNRCVTFPTLSKAKYNPLTRSIEIPAWTI